MTATKRAPRAVNAGATANGNEVPMTREAYDDRSTSTAPNHPDPLRDGAGAGQLALSPR